MKRVNSIVVLASLFLAQQPLAQENDQQPIAPDNWEARNEISEAMQEEIAKKKHQAEMIRHKYVDSDVPDGIVFQSLIGRISSRYGGDHERTVRKVKNSMKFISDEEALSFISLIDEQQKRLRTTQLRTKQSMMCSLGSEKTKQDMFRDVDKLSDLKMSSSEKAYRKFLRSLDSPVAEPFAAWIEKTKGGFQYIIFEAEVTLKEKGKQPLAYYQNECAKATQRMRAE